MNAVVFSLIRDFQFWGINIAIGLKPLLSLSIQAILVAAIFAFSPANSPAGDQIPFKWKAEPSSEYGFSFYTPIWELLDTNQRDGFEMGLPGTWLKPADPHGMVWLQTIEGGAGYWNTTQFPTQRPKYRMNGNIHWYVDKASERYAGQVGSPGFGFGKLPENSYGLPADRLGIAQLSNRLLVPPDGFTFASMSHDSFLGVAWMPVCLIAPKNHTTKETLPNTWTGFLNTSNFKGPVGCWVPNIWTKYVDKEIVKLGKEFLKDANQDPDNWFPHLAKPGFGLDTLRGHIDSVALEIHDFPNRYSDREKYIRLPRLKFPVHKRNAGKSYTVIGQDVKQYPAIALRDGTADWLLNGGRLPVDFGSQFVIPMPAPVHKPGYLNLVRSNRFLIPKLNYYVDSNNSFGFQWNDDTTEPYVTLPEYFEYEEEDKDINGNPYKIYKPLNSAPTPIPEEIPVKPVGKKYELDPAVQNHVTSVGKGPYYAALSDNTTLTYYWCWFVDQPTIALNQARFLPDAGIGSKDDLQAKVIDIHKEWCANNMSFDGPSARRSLATLDPAQIVTPPIGCEAGWVPIVTKQERIPRLTTSSLVTTDSDSMLVYRQSNSFNLRWAIYTNGQWVDKGAILDLATKTGAALAYFDGMVYMSYSGMDDFAYWADFDPTNEKWTDHGRIFQNVYPIIGSPTMTASDALLYLFSRGKRRGTVINYANYTGQFGWLGEHSVEMKDLSEALTNGVLLGCAAVDDKVVLAYNDVDQNRLRWLIEASSDSRVWYDQKTIPFIECPPEQGPTLAYLKQEKKLVMTYPGMDGYVYGATLDTTHLDPTKPVAQWQNSGQVTVSGKALKIVGSPALTVQGNTLRMAYQGTDTHIYYVSSSDGRQWQGHGMVPDGKN